MNTLLHSLTITGFVFVMMLVIEYLNVLSRGNWDSLVSRWKWGQPVFASLLGASPGCLGSFAAGSLYMHRVITFGALTATMIATSGDEAFVMLTLFPRKALILFGALALTGALTGIVVDIVLRSRRTDPRAYMKEYRPLHEEDDHCVPFSGKELFNQWRHCTRHRGLLAFMLAAYILAVITGHTGHQHFAEDIGGKAEHTDCAHEDCEHKNHTGHDHAHHDHGEHIHEHDAPHGEHAHGEWNWVRGTMLILALIGLGIVITVPDHFLYEHLWKHLVKVHVWRIFLWTLGAILFSKFLIDHIDIEALVETHALPVLLIACLVGIIPQSGPHLVFVTLYAGGAIPFSVLLASSVVQDGHGMLPLLAHSRRAFFAVKAVNLFVGLSIGLIGKLLGF